MPTTLRSPRLHLELTLSETRYTLHETGLPDVHQDRIKTPEQVAATVEALLYLGWEIVS